MARVYADSAGAPIRRTYSQFALALGVCLLSAMRGAAMRMRVKAVLFSALCALAIAAPAQAAHPRHHVAPKTAHSPQKAQAPAFNQAVLEAEVLLDRAGYSPGAIDARDGENFANALHTFQQANGLTVGRLDQQTMALLAQRPN